MPQIKALVGHVAFLPTIPYTILMDVVTLIIESFFSLSSPYKLKRGKRKISFMSVRCWRLLMPRGDMAQFLCAISFHTANGR